MDTKALPPSVLYSENHLEHLADNKPDALLDLIESGVLDDVELSFAAEKLGHLPSDMPRVMGALSRLLRHPKPYVREGALIAASEHLELQGVVEELAQRDENESIREIARDWLEEQAQEAARALADESCSKCGAQPGRVCLDEHRRSARVHAERVYGWRSRF